MIPYMEKEVALEIIKQFPCLLYTSLKQGDNLEDLFMNVVRKNKKAGEIHG